MKRLLFFLFVFTVAPTTQAQLPNRAKKLAGLWEYREGSGYEKWELQGDVLIGESFRINKLGDTLVAERFEISSVNKRLVLNLKAYHMVSDSVQVKEKVLIGKRRKLEFSSLTGTKLETLEFKFGWFSKKRLKLIVQHHGIPEPQKLRLNRKED